MQKRSILRRAADRLCDLPALSPEFRAAITASDSYADPHRLADRRRRPLAADGVSLGALCACDARRHGGRHRIGDLGRLADTLPENFQTAVLRAPHLYGDNRVAALLGTRGRASALDL